MSTLHLRSRLMLLGAAALVFLGGLMFAVARWNTAANDRAFVEAAARAALLPGTTAAAGPPRAWVPVAGARPGPAAVAQVEAAERLRSTPQRPQQPAAPAQQGQGSTGKPAPAP
jgi:hypothetical protein